MTDVILPPDPGPTAAVQHAAAVLTTWRSDVGPDTDGRGDVDLIIEVANTLASLRTVIDTHDQGDEHDAVVRHGLWADCTLIAGALLDVLNGRSPVLPIGWTAYGEMFR